MATKPKTEVKKVVKTTTKKAKDLFASPKRKTVDNDDLTVVIRATNFGLTSRYELVQHFGTAYAETVLLKSNSQLDGDMVQADAKSLAKKLNVPVVEVK